MSAPYDPSPTGPRRLNHSGADGAGAASATGGLARSAGLLAVGSVASRGLGLLREIVIAAYFGPSGLVSAFTVASQVPIMLYDFLIGGMLSAALVPVLSDYARRPDRVELNRLVGALASLLALLLAALVLLVELAAPRLAWLMAGGFADFDPTLLPLTVLMIRWLAPATWLLSMAGLLTAVLYALQRFSYPALATAVFNLGVVVAAPLLAPYLGIGSLVVGVLIGSGVQFVLMAFDLHRAGLRYELRWHHPALRRIAALYLPIAAGLVVAQLQIVLDRRLASGTGEQSIAWMRSATTLQQLPLGLISVAIALAALPRLSQHFAAGQEAAYRQTLARGLRMVLLLTVPAVVGLGLLGEPLVRLLFQRGAFHPSDTVQVVQALQIYLVGALFAAVDFPLNYAFYARQNTLLPALVGLLSAGVYVAVALWLVQGLGFLGLVWADSAKQASHALVMFGLLAIQVGRLGGASIRGVAQIGLAALLMAGVIWLLRHWLLPAAAGPMGDLLLLAAAGGCGLAVYGLLLFWLGMPELRTAGAIVGSRLYPKRGG